MESARDGLRRPEPLRLRLAGPDGGCHADGFDAGWHEFRKLLGIDRVVRHYDARRHTAVSHLVQGSWAPHLIARPLRLQEVPDGLGHGDIVTTPLYGASRVSLAGGGLHNA